MSDKVISLDDANVGKVSTKPSNRPSSGGPVPTLSKVGLQFRNSFNARATSVSKYSAAIEAVNNRQQEDTMTTIETVRLDLKKALAGSWWGHLYENIVTTISVLSTLEFIYQTYLTEQNHQNQYVVAKIMELSFAFLFGADWLLSLFLADHAFTFIFSFYSLIDIFTVVSIISTYFFERVEYGFVKSPLDVLVYILFGLKTVRILRALWFSKKLTQIDDAVDRYIGEMSLSISLMILFFAAVVQYFEDELQPFPFHTWMYYIWVTIATVGYGDITPQTTWGRIFVMFMIGVAIVSIPKMTNELIEKMSLQSVYMRAVYTPKSRSSKHVIICGDLSSTSLKEFFAELFHEDHDNTELYAVILLPQAPTVELILLMRQPQYVLSLTYLEGSALVEADLIRAKAESAMAIFVLTNKFSSNPDEEDAKSILLNLSIKRYLEQFQRSDMLYCMQLIRPENRRHLANDDFDGLDENDLVVCLNEIKMGAMAKAVMYPGANTLLMNLVSSFSDEDLNAEVAENYLLSPRIDAEGDSIPIVNQNSSKEWIKEYMKGCGWEIYTTTLSKVFAGAKFVELSFALYDKIGVVLFALQITDVGTGQSKVLLNPHDYIIPEQEKYKIEAFVIAMNKGSSDLSFGEGQGRNLSTVAMNIGSIANIVKSSVKDYRNQADGGGRKSLINRKLVKKLSVVNAMSGSAAVAPAANSPSAQGNDGPVRKSLWTKLKRSELLKKKVENQSYQEVLHRLEDKHFSANYYVRPNLPDLYKCTVKTGVLEELPLIRNHLIVIGKSLKNLFDLIKPLRAKYLGPLRYIVIVHPVDIPDDVWQRICMFDAVLFIKGSPLEESNLHRAGIFRAAQVVVLADGSLANDSASGMEALVDSDAIFTYQHVKRMNPSTQVVIEIVNQSNIAYLEKDSDQLSNHDFKFSPQFASGALFTTSLLDSIICQTYYNPQIIKVMNKLISGTDQAERADLAAQAAREVFNNGGHESEENRIKFQKTLSPINNIKGSCLYQINLPEGLEKKTYGTLFKQLSMEGMIPLGLLRGTFTNINMGPKANRMPYVYTNPDKNTELYGCDRVFVLSPTPFQTTGPTSIVDWVMEIQQQHIKNDFVGTAKSTSRPMSGAESKDVIDKQFVKLNYRMDRLYKDVNVQFQELRNFLGAPSFKRAPGDSAKSGEESVLASGNASPSISTAAFSVVTRKRADSEGESMVFEEKSTTPLKKPGEKETVASILRRKSLSTVESPKKRSSFSEPVVSKVTVIASDDRCYGADDNVSTIFLPKEGGNGVVSHRRSGSRNPDGDADDELSDDSDDSESRCTVAEEDEDDENIESKEVKGIVVTTMESKTSAPLTAAAKHVDSVSSIESLDGTKVSSGNCFDANEINEENLLDRSSMSESDMVKEFAIKVKPKSVKNSPTRDAQSFSKSDLDVSQPEEPLVIAGPSLSQITGSSSRQLTRNVQTNNVLKPLIVVAPAVTEQSNASCDKSINTSLSKVQRLALEQALKHPDKFIVDVASSQCRNNVSNGGDDDSHSGIPDDDRSITTVDSKTTLPGPTVDMVFKVMHRGVVGAK